MSDLSYSVLGYDLSDIRNTTEERVARQLHDELSRTKDYAPSQTDVKDIYALTLNLLPARYIQYGSIEMSGKVPDMDIAKAIHQAIDKVRLRPRKG